MVCFTVTRRASRQVSRQTDQGDRRAEWENENSSISPSEQDQIDSFIGVAGSGVLND